MTFGGHPEHFGKLSTGSVEGSGPANMFIVFKTTLSM